MGMPSTARIRSDAGENKLYRDFLLTGESRGAELPIEFRDNLGGGACLTYGSGAEGGAFVPFGYHSELVQSLTQYDEILDPAFSSQFDSETGQPMASAQVDDNVAVASSTNPRSWRKLARAQIPMSSQPPYRGQRVRDFSQRTNVLFGLKSFKIHHFFGEHRKNDNRLAATVWELDIHLFWALEILSQPAGFCAPACPRQPQSPAQPRR